MTELPRKQDEIEVDRVDPEFASKLTPLLRPDKRDAGLRVVATYVQKHHSGPLPAPEDFEHCERVLPGSSERIISMAERSQAHRQKQEGRVVTGEYGLRLLGQFSALFSIIIVAALIGFCAYIKQPVTAGVIAAIGGVAAFFLHKGSSMEDAPPSPRAPNKRKKR